MQQAALSSTTLYPEDGNGHPIATGYKVIADELAKNVVLPWSEPNGLVALFTSEKKYQLGLVREGKYWTFSHPDIIEANGWDSKISPPSVRYRDIAKLSNQGVISHVDKEKYGPR